MEDRPVSLNSLIFSDKKGKSIVTEDYDLTFADKNYCELFIQDRYEYWKAVLEIDLVIAEDKNDTLKEIETQNILELVCKYTGVDYLQARSKSQKRKHVEARRFAMAISLGRKVNKSTIGRALGLDHATVLHHLTQLDNLCKFDAEERRQYMDLEDYVMINLNDNESEICK